jgi:Domain of unknown function (DUF6371)
VTALHQLHTANSPTKGAVIFWGIDANGQARYGQLVQFDSEGHTVTYLGKDGEERRATTWLQRIFDKVQLKPDCFEAYHAHLGLGTITILFGAHLLATLPDAEVCLVESPKTAMLCAGLFPPSLCLATLSIVNLKPVLCLLVTTIKKSFISFQPKNIAHMS